MCSKCYKETIAKSSAAAAPAVAAPVCTPCTDTSQASSASTTIQPPAAVAASPLAASASPAPSAASASPAPSTPSAAAATATAKSSERPATTSEEGADEPPKKKQVNTSRCWSCNKKIGLTGFQCKCEYFFCGEHRYSDKHECEFDFKARAKDLLTKANPTIAPAKLQTF